MSRNRNYREKNIRPIRILTSALFAVYVFLFLYQGFGEQLEIFGTFYATLLPLRTTFSPWSVALIATLMLCGIQLLTRNCFNLGFRFLFVSYIPALIGLYIFVSQEGSSLDSGTVMLRHGIIAAVLLLLILVKVLKYILSSSETYNSDRTTASLSSWSIGMLFFFCLGFFVIGLYSPMKISARNEIAMLRAVRGNDFDQVLQIENNTPKPTLKMTQIRNYALLLKGDLGNKLFCYPQNYGEEGIDTSFVGQNNLTLTPNTPPASLQQSELKIAEALLRKDLESFITLLNDNSSLYAAGQLPRHYGEAYAIYVYLHPDKPYVIADEDLNKSFIKYLELRNSKANNREDLALVLKRESYDRTYWWYYDFTEVPQTEEKS